MEQRLESVEVSEALDEASKKMVVAHSGDSLSTVFTLLQKNFSLVAPVYNSQEKKWIGLIDVVDILTTVLGSSEKSDAKVDDDDLTFTSYTAQDAVNRSKRNPFIPVKSSDSLLHAVKLLVDSKAHYLPVFNADKKLIAVLDSWQILAYVVENLPSPAKNRSVLEFGNFDDLITIKHNASTISGFHLLVEKNIPAAAIVDEQGLLVDSLSCTDSRSLNFTESTWVMLQEPVLKFLQHSAAAVKASVEDGSSRRELLETYMRSNCMYAEPNARWSDLAAAMVEDEVHRVYIAEKGNKPAGFVEILDMLEVLIR
mmetsp:Transcript_4512/g.7904  ORF Transcript_4512/g.7904 Transcript_4512/m.7904 type:complete len:312 (-) Transcript_4512:347-1282(-)